MSPKDYIVYFDVDHSTVAHLSTSNEVPHKIVQLTALNDSNATLTVTICHTIFEKEIFHIIKND